MVTACPSFADSVDFHPKRAQPTPQFSSKFEARGFTTLPACWVAETRSNRSENAGQDPANVLW